jgi:hypothetical protein
MALSDLDMQTGEVEAKALIGRAGETVFLGLAA